MKPRPTQFDRPENTATSRQHASRLTGQSHSTEICIQGNLEGRKPLPDHDDLVATLHDQLQAAAEPAATGGEGKDRNQLLTVHEVAALLQVPVSWVYGRMRKRSSERLPGYRLGKYWRFHEVEILAWVKCQRGGQHVA